ncbi:hypothetical protein DWX76_09915 [Clostridium sp. AF21-20LB]|jgi:hypothetical protein|nr:hypothetical protein DWX76_09915 [Clostridium sp. AF21-20LB]
MEPGKRGNDKFVQNVNQRWNMEHPVLKSPRFPDKKEKNRNNSHLQRCKNLREPGKTRKGD